MIRDPHIKNWKFKRTKEPVLLASTFLLAAALVGVFIYGHWLMVVLFILFLSVWGVVLYFFRDPSRNVVDEPGLVVGPCDGKVVSIEKIFEPKYLGKETIRISMFLSLFDVHVQRAPLAGTVLAVDHQPGKFLQAFKPEASEVNEYIAMQLGTPYGTILVKQIAGILARRCMNYAQSGDEIETGQRYGHIKFGSRVDLFLPSEAEILVQVGDKIFGGLTPMAQLRRDYESNTA
jgi:phosphatidylserine decarboxylase